MGCYPKNPNNSWAALEAGVPCVCGGTVTIDWESWGWDEEGWDIYNFVCDSWGKADKAALKEVDNESEVV